MLFLINGDKYQTLVQNNYLLVLFLLVCKDFHMIQTGLHVSRANILIFPSPPREVYVDTTKQYQTTLNRHFQEFHKFCLTRSYKHSWIFQKRLTARIWDFLTFNIYYLGSFSQNVRYVSSFLQKLEAFCRGLLEKFCLVEKIQHFLPYRYLTFCQAKYTMDAVLLCQQDLW